MVYSIRPLLLAGLIFLLVLSSCRTDGKTEDAEQAQDRSDRGEVLNEQVFTDLYVELLEGAERYRATADTSREKFDPSPIFAKFNVREADFRTTVESYRRDVKKWQGFFTKVVQTLEEKEKRRQAKKES